MTRSVEITRTLSGPDDEQTANANQALGKLLLARKEYVKAEPYLRHDRRTAKHNADEWVRFGAEGLLGSCLRSLKKYPEAETRLLAAFNGMKATNQRHCGESG